jgi:hypothetical protein
METYRTGLSHDPDNEELLEGVQRCVEAISRSPILSYGQMCANARC